MKSLNKWVIISAVTFLIYNIVSSNFIDFKIHQQMQEIDPHQTFIFVSDAVAQDTSFFKTLSVSQLPNVINSFNVSDKNLYYNVTRLHKNIQNSLIILYTNNFIEIGWFGFFFDAEFGQTIICWKKTQMPRGSFNKL